MFQPKYRKCKCWRKIKNPNTYRRPSGGAMSGAGEQSQSPSPSPAPAPKKIPKDVKVEVEASRMTFHDERKWKKFVKATVQSMVEKMGLKAHQRSFVKPNLLKLVLVAHNENRRKKFDLEMSLNASTCNVQSQHSVRQSGARRPAKIKGIFENLGPQDCLPWQM